jgi:hypothetical protein
MLKALLKTLMSRELNCNHILRKAQSRYVMITAKTKNFKMLSFRRTRVFWRRFRDLSSRSSRRIVNSMTRELSLRRKRMS